MKKCLILVFFFTCVLLFVSSVNAEIIIDTGHASDPSYGGPVLTGNVPGSNYFQWLAGKFTLGQNYTLTDIEGWIATGYYNTDPSKLSLVVYGDGGNIPDVGTEIYSGIFDLPGTSGIEHDWYGLHGLTLSLGPGSYWVAFETRDGFMYDGYMQQFVPNPLTNYAVAYPSFPDYAPWPGTSFGLRVQGSTSCAVPEPTTMFFLGVGLIGLVGLRKK
jgi:hypothetical protein